MTKGERDEWRPFPAGVYVAAIFGLCSILFLVLCVLTSSIFIGVAAVFFGAFAILNACDASYHAGMRKMDKVWQDRVGI